MLTNQEMKAPRVLFPEGISTKVSLPWNIFEGFLWRMQVFQEEGKTWQLLERGAGTLASRQVDQSCARLAHIAPGPQVVSSVWGVWPGVGSRAPVASSVRIRSVLNLLGQTLNSGLPPGLLVPGSATICKARPAPCSL